MAASFLFIVRIIGSFIPFVSQMALLGFLLAFGCCKKGRSTKKVDLVRASEAENISTGKKSGDSVEKPQASGTIEKKIPALGQPDDEPVLKPKVIPLDEKGKRIAAGERRKRNEYPTMIDVNSDWGDDPDPKEAGAKDAPNDKPATKEKSAPKDAPNDKPATKEKSAPKEEKLAEKDKSVEKKGKEKSAPKQEKLAENDKPAEKPSEDKLQPSTDQVKNVASPAKPEECEKQLVPQQSPAKKKDAQPVASPVIKPVAIVTKPIVAIPLIAVPKKKPEVNVNKAPQEVSAKEMETQAESIRASEEKSSKHEPSDEKDNAKPDDAKQPASSDGE